ncbi:MAG: MFS transporter [Candidatus Polarisedimenticolaceae bacterium]|nr:MFS transporter [Candidatus Polarisedimenticolaceae bacterium]
MLQTIPYWRLSSFYLFYFAALGTLVPYWGLFLQSRGFTPAEIGELMALLMATKFIAPNIWGWIADHTGRRMPIIRSASLLSALIFCSVFWVDGFWQFALAMTLFSFFWNASLPQFEAVTFSYLGSAVHQYSRIRLWGSIGFIITVVGVGALLDYYPISNLPVVILLLYFAIWLSSLLVPEHQGKPHHEAQGSILSVLKKWPVQALLIVCFLMQASHGVYYSFYSIYLEQNGYSSTLIGQLWALGVVAEVAIFIVMHRLLQRFSARQVLIVSLLLAAFRWLVIGLYPQQLSFMLFAQLLHAATFGTFHAAAIHLIHKYFTGRHQGRGQALYASVSFGAGGAVGSLMSGYLWSDAGANVTFFLSASIALLALFIAMVGIDADREVNAEVP